MGCVTCGDKPENTSKDFTRAVVEINNPDTLVLFRKVVIPTSIGGPEEVPPEVGKYVNVLLYYEKTDDVYLYSSDGIPTLITGDLSEVLARLDSLDEAVETEAEERTAADEDLQEQIEAIKAASDVVDIVGTYAELMAYDTSKLSDNDIIRVLADETHDGATSYYRWLNNNWLFIGDLGPFYTQSELDQMFEDEADARTASDSALSTRIDSLSSSLSAETAAREAADQTLQGNIDAEAQARADADDDLSDDIVAEANARSTADARIDQAWQEEATTRGTADQALQAAIDAEAASRVSGDSANANSIVAETNARQAADSDLQDAIDGLSTAMDGKQDTLTAGTGIDITNNVISTTSTGPTVVQTTGTSTTDVMSQNAVTSMVYADPSAKQKIRIGNTNGIGSNSISIGAGAAGSVNTTYNVALGAGASAVWNGNVALGAFSGTNAVFDAVGEVAINSTSTSYGYNNSNYRLLRGLYDPQSDHDAATKGYVDTGLANAGTAFTNAEFNSIFDTSLTEGA